MKKVSDAIREVKQDFDDGKIETHSVNRWVYLIVLDILLMVADKLERSEMPYDDGE